MRKVLGVILTLLAFLSVNLNVKALENGATFAYYISSSVEEGQIFTVDVMIKDVDVSSITGAIAKAEFDKEYLEFVSIKANENSPLAVFTNPNAVKFAGLSLTGDGIKNDTKMLSITFKALKSGNTVLSFSELDLCDDLAKSYKGNMESLMLSINEIKAIEPVVSEEISFESANIQNTQEEKVVTESKETEETKEEKTLDETLSGEETSAEVVTNVKTPKENNIIKNIINSIINFFKKLLF